MAIFMGIVALFLIVAGWIYYYFTCTNKGKKADMSGKLENTQTLSEMADTMLAIERTQSRTDNKIKVIKNVYSD